MIRLATIGSLALALPSYAAAQQVDSGAQQLLQTIERPAPNPLRPTFVPGELLIRYQAGGGILSAEALSLESELPLRRIEHNASVGVHRYELPEGLDVAAALRLLRNDSRVDYVEPNYVYYHHQIPNDGFYDNYAGVASDLQAWAMDANNVNAESAWDLSTGRSDVVIAIIDSGIDLDHPDLAANIWSNSGEVAGNGVDDDGNGFTDDVNGWDFYFNDSNPNPDFGDGIDNDGNGAADDGTFHGTFAASNASAVGNNGTGLAGAAWGCSLMALKVFTDDGGASTFDIADAITYAANNGADVINMSLGGGFSSTIQSAVNFAHGAGLVQLASAGNSNSSSQQYPASLNFVISVGASDSGSVLGGGSGDIDGRASFSQYGPSAVDVVAPGADLVGAATGTVAGGNPGDHIYILSSGTSFSCPLVAGLAGLILSRALDVGASIDNDDVEAIIEGNTTNLPDDPNDFPNGGSTWDSNGLVDFRACLDAVGGGGGGNDPPTAVAGPNQSGLVGDVFSFDGSGSSDPDGPIASYSWTFGDGGSGSGANVTHSYSSAGTYTVTLTVSDGSLTDSDTLTVTVSSPPTGGVTMYMANSNNISVPGVGTLANEDVFTYNTSTGNFTQLIDGSDVGLGSAAIDGLVVLPDGDLLISLTASFSIPGMTGGPGGSTTADDSDIVRFTPSSTGSSTAGVFTFHFDGSDVALTSNGEDINGLSLDGSGNLVVTTTGGFSGTGASGADEDLFIFSASSLGASTSGSFTRLFDGSDVGFGGNGAEDVTALHWSSSNEFYLSTLGTFSVSGLSGPDEDVFLFTATSTGNTTAGSASAFYDATAAGIAGNEDTRAVHID
ncbi:MAG: S8 family serine peptidase [Planctomycetota bacterium]